MGHGFLSGSEFRARQSGLSLGSGAVVWVWLKVELSLGSEVRLGLGKQVLG